MADRYDTYARLPTGRDSAWRRVRRLLIACGVLAALGSASADGSALAAPPLTRLGGFHRVATRPWLDHGKPVVLFVGAQFCPFCAAERWALVRALGRFGRWSGLRTMHSTRGEGGFPGLATYDLMHATYHSPAIALQAREVADFSGRPLQTLTAAQARAVDAYDPRGAIPFVLIAGRYAQISSGYSPAVLVGLSFARIHHLVFAEPTSKVGRAVTGEANVMSALICASLGARAATTAACQIPAVRALGPAH